MSLKDKQIAKKLERIAEKQKKRQKQILNEPIAPKNKVKKYIHVKHAIIKENKYMVMAKARLKKLIKPSMSLIGRIIVNALSVLTFWFALTLLDYSLDWKTLLGAFGLFFVCQEFKGMIIEILQSMRKR